MKMNKLQSLGMVAGALVALAACAATPAALSSSASSLTATQTHSGNKEVSAPDLSHLLVTSLSDDRGKDAMLTDMYGRPMQGTDVMEWIQNSLVKGGAVYQEASDQAEIDGNACAVDIMLKRAHITANLGTSKAATVVLAARHTGTDEPYKIYRGQFASSNWAGTSNETNRALSKALNRALRELDGACAEAS